MSNFKPTYRTPNTNKIKQVYTKLNIHNIITTLPKRNTYLRQPLPKRPKREPPPSIRTRLIKSIRINLACHPPLKRHRRIRPNGRDGIVEALDPDTPEPILRSSPHHLVRHGLHKSFSFGVGARRRSHALQYLSRLRRRPCIIILPLTVRGGERLMEARGRGKPARNGGHAAVVHGVEGVEGACYAHQRRVHLPQQLVFVDAGVAEVEVEGTTSLSL